MKSSDAAGMALLVTLFALAIVSILGMIMTLNATTGVQISDNYESQLQATYAAIAGLNHASVLLRGLDLGEVLQGPDGAHDGSAAYREQAKTFRFRLPLPLISAQVLDISNPAPYASGIPDDGIISTGALAGSAGLPLIPQSGIAQMSPRPYGIGEMCTSRYFVKVTDNSGEASEIAEDSGDDPFRDGDGIVIVRSMGIARTFSHQTGSVVRRNSVAVFESRLRRMRVWDMGPALVVLGSAVKASWGGNPEIFGHQAAGIGTIDTNPDDASLPGLLLRAAAGAHGMITGGGFGSPSIVEVASQIIPGSDHARLLDAGYLWNFIQAQAPQIADRIYEGSQVWLAGTVPPLGQYDSARAWNAPGQNPQITLVRGDVQAPGGFSGAGILIITGRLDCSGPFSFRGLILVLGSGALALSGTGEGIAGGVLVATLETSGAHIYFGTPEISIQGSSRIVADRDAVNMALRILPASQISFREISGSDP